MLAIRRRITDVVGAGVSIVAIFDSEPQAGPSGAGVVFCTGIAVVTGHTVITMTTSSRFTAGIRSAIVSIIAIVGGARKANTGRTDIARGASVPIVTGGRIVGVGTAQSRVTGIRSAVVVVVAEDGSRPNADAIGAHIGRSTCVVVVAEGTVGRMNTASRGIACVRRTGIRVVTGERAGPVAGPTGTGVRWGADVVVITGEGVVAMLATQVQVTGVGGAYIVVITGRRAGSHTF